jgi:hypothetical protein
MRTSRVKRQGTILYTSHSAAVMNIILARPHIIISGLGSFVDSNNAISRVNTRYAIIAHSAASSPFLGFFSILNNSFTLSKN